MGCPIHDRYFLSDIAVPVTIGFCLSLFTCVFDVTSLLSDFLTFVVKIPLVASCT